MKTLFEGEKRNIAVLVRRVTGSGAISLSIPERRILNASKAVIENFDWAAATWDAANSKLYALFDTTAAGLTAVGTYFVQLRGVIGDERYAATVTVKVADFGP